jgi:hypothetical protein
MQWNPSTMHLAILSLSFLLTSSLAQVLAPVVDLGYAKYQGTLDTNLNISTYLGIRYAAPPVGMSCEFSSRGTQY